MPETGLIRNVGKPDPALVISQEPGATAAQGNPALQLNQADTGGPALLVKSAGSMIDLQNVAGVSKFKVDSSGTIVSGIAATGVRTPDDLGFAAWNYDPLGATNTSSAVNGSIYLLGIVVRFQRLITNLGVLLTTGAISAVASQNYLGLVDSTGAIRGSTAATVCDTPSQSSGWMIQAMQTPFLAPAGRYWVAVLLNAATPAVLGRASGATTGFDLNLTSPNYWVALNGTSATVLPGSFTMSSNTHTNSISVCVAVS